MVAPIDPEDRIFVRDGLRHYRRRYSLTEVRWGALVGLGLVCTFGWVIWRGAHPDPSLFSADMKLLEGQAASSTERGALPKSLAGEGWAEEKIGQFDKENLYVKINGRSDFFLSFGFERLFASTLVNPAGDSVAVEMYDMGSGANALGAYDGEKSASAQSQKNGQGMYHLERNALYLTQGRYYVRLIGSDETPGMQAQLQRLRGVFATLKSEALPWGYDFFTTLMGFDPGKIAYFKENAFSFGFAKEVYAADVSRGDDDSTDVFVVAQQDEKAAGDLARRFVEGFLEYGDKAEVTGDVQWVKDRYIETRASAVALGRFVFGVRGAPDLQSATILMATIRSAIEKMPAALAARASVTPDGQLTERQGNGEGH